MPLRIQCLSAVLVKAHTPLIPPAEKAGQALY